MTPALRTRIQIAGTIIAIFALIVASAWLIFGPFPQPPIEGEPIPVHPVQTTIIAPEAPKPIAVNSEHYEWFSVAFRNWKTHQDRVLAAKILLASEKNKNERVEIGRDIELLRKNCVIAAQKYNVAAAKMDPALFNGREAPALIDAARCK